MITRSGEMVSAQVGIMGTVTDLDTKDFSLADGQPFNIKNDGIAPVELEVQLAGMPDGETVTTKFDCGWNPEIVKVIKATSLSSINLKFGY
jgi:hypothetical protein